MNPGPRSPKYPCVVCTKAVRWNQRAIACDSCDGWYHADCINMCSNVYQALTKPELSWICCQCGLPNFSTSLFESFDISCSNNFDPLCDTSASSVFSDIGDPITTSSPKATAPCKRKINTDNIKVLTINFQSIKAKRESFWNLVESSKPDVILGCETWLKPTISNQEIAPPGYSIYRKDRDDQSVRRGAAGTCRPSRAVKTFRGILFLFSKIVHFRYIRKSETYLPVQNFVGSINSYTQYILWTIFYHVVTCLHWNWGGLHAKILLERT